MSNPDEISAAGVDARQSPFYEWLDNATIRDLLHRGLELPPGELLVLIKGLVPGLVDAIGLAEFDAFLAEIAIKARRFQEAVDHPGEGRACRVTPGEELGGPTPAGHEHIAMARDPDQRGAREAERDVEGGLWACTEYMSRSGEDPAHGAPAGGTPAGGTSVDETPTGMGSESAEGINDVGTRPEGERSGLDDRAAGRSFRAGAERSGSEPLIDREWVHESGYGGKGGKPRASSDERESSEREDFEQDSEATK